MTTSKRTFKVAGIMAVKNYSDDCQVFHSLKSITDITIVLDHNSTSEFPFKKECDEYITLKDTQLWNDTGNSTMLLFRAYLRNAPWVIWMDDDLIASHSIQTRGDVERIISYASRRQADICLFTLRDLWESKETYRADGIWGRKVFSLVRRNWFFDSNLKFRSPHDRLHRPIFPKNKRPNCLRVDEVVYHTGCFTRVRREARVEKYRIEDPQNRFQRDYEYMLNDRNLQLKRVPINDELIINRKFRPELRKSIPAG